MSKAKKNKRLATNSNYPDGVSKDWIEIDEHGTMFWKAVDYSNLYYDDKKALKRRIEELGDVAECSFPVDIEFVEDFFKTIGRILDRNLLPSNVCLYPWGK